MAVSPYTLLPQLTDARLPVFASAGGTARVTGLTRRYERAYDFLSTLLQIGPPVHVALLSRADWTRLTASPLAVMVLRRPSWPHRR